MPTILSIDTSAEQASVALLHRDTLVWRVAEGVATHSHTVLPMAQALLQEQGVRLADCDAIAFGAGPGSFTGVRTACGVAQGLAFGAGVPVLPVVTLAAMAQSLHEQAPVALCAEVIALLDARMGEVYWGSYRCLADGWQSIVAPRLSAPEEVTAKGDEVLCGNGLTACFDRFDPVVRALRHVPGVVPHAAAIARLGAADFQAGGGLPPDQAQPLYLRNKVALTSAERLEKRSA